MGSSGQGGSAEAQRLAAHLSREAMEAIAQGGDTTSLRRATSAALLELDRDGRRTLVGTLALLVASMAAHVPEEERRAVFAGASAGAGLDAWVRLLLRQSEAVLAAMPGPRGGAA